MITKEAIEAGIAAANERYLDFMIEDETAFDQAVEAGILAALSTLPIAGEGKVTQEMRSAADKARNSWLTYDENDQIGALNAALDAAFALIPSSPGKDGGQEVEAVAHIVTDPKGKRRVTLATQYDPMASSFWKHGTMPAGYSVTPLYTRPQPASTALVERLTKALADMLPPDLPWKRDADGVLIHHKVAAINEARAALAFFTSREGDDAQD